ncbi:MAG: NADH-quinone oxidoreductase subunit C [Deltaproteobacteria bacterium]|nr:NADH-quinone oxidoreductase subunit C [Deltaproteobacteria bacterium]
MILQQLQEKFPLEIIKTGEGYGNLFAFVKKERSHEFFTYLRDEPALKFEFLIDLFGVDRLKLNESPRFEVVYQLYSLTHNHRLRVHIKVPEEELVISSVVDLWKAADWSERECWEMFGIRFEGHPNLKHLLLFEGFEGHPLRKDYPINKRQKIPIPGEIV